jgi:hypothetical protein
MQMHLKIPNCKIRGLNYFLNQGQENADDKTADLTEHVASSSNASVLYYSGALLKYWRTNCPH